MKHRLRSIRIRVFVSVGVTLLAFLCLFFFLYYSQMIATLRQAESIHMTELNHSITGMLNDAEDSLSSIGWDWSCWDDTYDYVMGEKPDYPEVNWIRQNSLDKLSVNFAIVQDARGHTLFSAYYDLIARAPRDMPEGLAQALSPYASRYLAEFVGVPEGERLERLHGMSGYYLHGDVPYFVCALPILPSSGMGEPGGMLILGRLYDNANIRRMARTDLFDFALTRATPEDVRIAGTVLFEDERHVSQHRLVRDISGGDLMLSIEHPRSIYVGGMAAVGLSGILLLVVMAAFVAILMGILSIFVVRPLRKLTLAVVSTPADGVLDISKHTSSREIHTLGASINELLSGAHEAERSNLAKSEFLSRMSHEMRTPMNAIIGMTGIARSTDDAARKEYCLTRIDVASKHLLGVINDILDMSKIEANMFALSCENFSLEQMLIDITGVVSFRMDERHQALHMRVGPDLPDAYFGDAQHLSQVITNLLSNAAKFTPEGGEVLLRARMIEQADDVCTLQFDIEDNGIGISPEQQSRLFRSFEQADGSISRKYGGTGLGLAISKRIVELMGGTIWVESEVGRGSTFSFTVRLKRGSVQATGVDLGGARVLVVDGASRVRNYIGESLEKANAHCEQAADAAQALAAVLEHAPYRVIFVDAALPKPGCIALARDIRAISPDAVIIFISSAGAWHDIEREAFAVGVERFLPRPLFASTIVRCVQDGLQPPERETPEVQSSEPGSFEGHTLLLVEDVEINREIVLAILEETGVRVEQAHDGMQAVEAFLHAPAAYDAILMDIHMPEMDGYEATRRIRASGLPSAADVPIIAMTANVFREDVEKCMLAGMDAHLGKPIDAAELIAVLGRYLAA